MFRVRLVTVEPHEASLLEDLRRWTIFREPVPECPSGFAEYDYYCTNRQALVALCREHWDYDEPELKEIHELDPAPNPELARATRAELVSDAEIPSHEAAGMTDAQLFDAWCDWQGLVRWGHTLRKVMANLRGYES